MEIIKKTDPNVWSKECECSRCRSVLKIVIDDLTRSGGYNGLNEQVHFTCPVCTHYNSLLLDVVPEEYRFAVKRGRSGYFDR